MRIAIFGANSEIARDFVSTYNLSFQNNLILFSRKPELLSRWVLSLKNTKNIRVVGYDTFNIKDSYDIFINFIGVGDSAKNKFINASLLDMTHIYDDLILNYLTLHSESKYIFISSGIVYETDFNEPVNEKSSIHQFNDPLKFYDWYTASKVYAESRHRERSDLAINDLRIFSYFSNTQNTTSSSYLMGEIIRSLKNRTVLRTTPFNIKRDYLCTTDFSNLISCIIRAPHSNIALDSFTIAPIDKFSILEFMKINYGLEYEVIYLDQYNNMNMSKINYYSENKIAKNIGYIPSMSSLECINFECKNIFSRGINT